MQDKSNLVFPSESINCLPFDAPRIIDKCFLEAWINLNSMWRVSSLETDDADGSCPVVIGGNRDHAHLPPKAAPHHLHPLNQSDSPLYIPLSLYSSLSAEMHILAA